MSTIVLRNGRQLRKNRSHKS